MNTPRTKEPKRYDGKMPTPDFAQGTYRSGLFSEKHATLVGQIVSIAVSIEEEMIDVLRDLIGGEKNVPARQIFRSITSNEARKKVMLALLERAPINRDKDRFYDDVIAEWYSLNGRRNDYVHGLWLTYQDNTTAYLSVQSVEDYHLLASRKVPLGELQTTLKEMVALNKRLIRHRAKVVAQQQALRETTPPQHAQEKT